MLMLLASLIAVGVSAKSASLSGNLIAFQVDRPAVYLTAGGTWKPDFSAGFLKDQFDVLSFCRKRYKSQDVTNVVELHEKVKVPHWCKISGEEDNDCETVQVRPWKCLVGPFTSDALLVPQDCLFDHIHNTSQCATPAHWWQLSEDRCARRDMNVSLESMLLPCGVDKYFGIEFVCCPTHDKKSKSKKKKEGKEAKKLGGGGSQHNEVLGGGSAAGGTDQNWLQQDRYRDSAEDEEEQQVSSYATHGGSAAAKKKPDTDAAGAYDRYLKEASSSSGDEHDEFLAAKAQLRQIQQQKVTKMMKEWSEARKRVQDLKAKDAPSAEDLGKQIANRFQAEYAALEGVDRSERHQLADVHQKRVQVALNAKKRRTMQRLMDLVQRYTAANPEEESAASHKGHQMSAGSQLKKEEDSLVKALESYIRSEERDRQHALNHWSHLLDQEPAQAVAQAPLIATHLQLISTRINQALALVKGRVKADGVGQKVKARAERFIKSFSDLDEEQQMLEQQTREEKERQKKEDEQKKQLEEDEREEEEGDAKQGEVQVEIKTWTEHATTVGPPAHAEEADLEATAAPQAPVSTCSAASFKCHLSPDELNCIPRSWQCDGDADCAGGEDELHCDDNAVQIEDKSASAGSSSDASAEEEEEGEEREREHYGHALDDSLRVGAAGAVPHGLGAKGMVAPQKHSPHNVALTALAAIALCVVLVAGVVVARRRRNVAVARQQRLAAAHTAARLMGGGDGAGSPEERHVSNMQMNGYENPTYRYLEIGK